MHRILILTATLLVAAGLSAQTTEKSNALTEPTSEELGKVQPLIDANRALDAIPILDAQLRKVVSGSYDEAILLQVKAQVLLLSNMQREGIAPLERCLALSDAHTPPYFSSRVALEFVYFLAQLHFQEATQAKDPRAVATGYDKAEAYMARWMRETPKLAPEPVVFYASLLYNRATQDEAAIDRVRLQKALDLVDTGLGLEIRPKDNLYLLKLACLLQFSRFAEAGEVLELLLQRSPNNKSYWDQLAAIYLSLEQDLRAIVTFERAKAHGFMNTPKDNFNLVGIYYNMGSFEKAVDLLEAGLKDGSLERDMKSWELLSASYQQLSRDKKSIDALMRAIAANPDTGQLEYMVAQGYFGMGRNDDALRHAQAAVQKGNLSRPAQVYLFLSYLSFEAKQLDLALDAVDKAIAFPDGAEEGARMKAAIKDAIAEREAKLEKL